MADFVSIGFRAVHRSKRDGLVWAGSKIVRDHAEAERVVAQWQAGYPQHEEDPLCFEVQEVFARPLGVGASDGQTIDWGAVDEELLGILQSENIDPESATGKGILPYLRALLRKVSNK